MYPYGDRLEIANKQTGQQDTRRRRAWQLVCVRYIMKIIPTHFHDFNENKNSRKKTKTFQLKIIR